jgi:hypothetical protein
MPRSVTKREIAGSGGRAVTECWRVLGSFPEAVSCGRRRGSGLVSGKQHRGERLGLTWRVARGSLWAQALGKANSIGQTNESGDRETAQPRGLRACGGIGVRDCLCVRCGCEDGDHRSAVQAYG